MISEKAVPAYKPQPVSPLRAVRLVQRNLLVYSHTFMVIFSGFFEPLFYLFAMGFGLGSIVGDVTVGGTVIPYAAFIAPAMLAASCMNGAITDGCFNVFFKLNHQKTYEGILATPLGIRDVALGEMMWAMIRGSLYAAGFMAVIVVLDLTRSGWTLLALPAAVFVAAAFACFAVMITSFMTAIHHFDRVMNLVVMPMFLFSGTFFPLSVYPPVLQMIVQALPLYHATALLRALTTGTVDGSSLVHVVYLAGMIVLCLTVATHRLERRVIV